jgi:hypothetical protein
VRIEIGNGMIVTSSITNEAVDDLGLKVGDRATPIIKASDMMVATSGTLKGDLSEGQKPLLPHLIIH